MYSKLLYTAAAILSVTLAAEVARRYWNSEPTPAANKESNMATMTDAERLLNDSKHCYEDILAMSDTPEKRAALTLDLFAQFIYLHITTRDCSLGENRTYVDWVRKSKVPNPEHYERLICKAYDEMIVTLPAIRALLEGSAPIVKMTHTYRVSGLDSHLTVSDCIGSDLDIPIDVYVIHIDYIIDIPVKVTLTGIRNVVVIEDIG